MWRRRAHLHRRDGADVFADLLGLDDVDRIVSTMSLRLPAFRLVREGRPLDPSSYTRTGRLGSRTLRDLADAGRVYAHFDAGATIVLQGLHRYWEPLSRFCRELERFLTFPVQANAYVTPPGAQGLQVHADAHDVLALQTHGRKHWVTYPLQGGDETLDVELEPGDCLYVPQGARHAAATVQEASVHITLGIHVTTWRDVLRRAAERATSGQAFDEALPPGWANDGEAVAAAVGERLRALAGSVTAVEPARLAEDERARFWASRPPALSGQLRDLLEVGEIDDQTTVRPRAGAVHLLTRRDGRVTLALGDRRVRLPAVAEPAVRALLGGPTRVSDLAAHLDKHGRLVLVRRLVREGLLQVVRD